MPEQSVRPPRVPTAISILMIATMARSPWDKLGGLVRSRRHMYPFEQQADARNRRPTRTVKSAKPA